MKLTTEVQQLVNILISLVQEQCAIHDSCDSVLYQDQDAIAALWMDVAAGMKCKGRSTVQSPRMKWSHLVLHPEH